MDLAARLLAGDTRALAQAIRLVEDREPAAVELLKAVRGHESSAHVVGITGPPGAGKSTLCDGLIERWRASGHTVGVLAVDPSSPFTGGAILGDRVRMQRHTKDQGVYMRSMAARGHLGGLALAAKEACGLIAANGHDRCLLETVGVGQSELEVMQIAETTVVVTTPVSGDGVQLIKAGILEIADILVVNKGDIAGAPKVVRELREMVHLTQSESDWEPPVITTTATDGSGLDELLDAIERHYDTIAANGELLRRHKAQLRAQIEALVVETASREARRALDSSEIRHMLEHESDVDPYAIAERIIAATSERG